MSLRLPDRLGGGYTVEMRTTPLLTLLLVTAATAGQGFATAPEPVNTALVAQSPAERVAQAILDALPLGTPAASTIRWLEARGAKLQDTAGSDEASVALLLIPPGRGSLALPSGTVVVIARFGPGARLNRLTVTVKE